ncbi:LppU/SCO3897 family protein [Nocardia heshunensis]
MNRSRIIVAAIAIALSAGLAGCAKTAESAGLGDCLDRGGDFTHLRDIKVVDCSSADAKYKVSAVYGKGHTAQDCPGTGEILYFYRDDSVYCVSKV